MTWSQGIHIFFIGIFNRRLFNTASISDKTVINSLYVNLLYLRDFLKQCFTDLINLSNKSTHHGTLSRLYCQWIPFADVDLFSFVALNFFGLLDIANFGVPLLEMSLCIHRIRDSVSKSDASSRCVTLIVEHAINNIYALFISCSYLT